MPPRQHHPIAFLPIDHRTIHRLRRSRLLSIAFQDPYVTWRIDMLWVSLKEVDVSAERLMGDICYLLGGSNVA